MLALNSSSYACVWQPFYVTHVNRIERIQEKGYRIIQGDVLQAGEQVRHDSELLMKLILEHYREYAERTKE